MEENKNAVSVMLAGKEFQVALTPEEEPMAREAEKLFNEVYQIYVQKYGNLPKELLLSMTGLGLANKIISLENPNFK